MLIKTNLECIQQYTVHQQLHILLQMADKSCDLPACLYDPSSLIITGAQEQLVNHGSDAEQIQGHFSSHEGLLREAKTNIKRIKTSFFRQFLVPLRLSRASYVNISI